MLSKTLLCGLAAGAIALVLGGPAEPALATHGKELFERRCSGCHALDIDKEGPRLRGVYGRKAAGVAGISYSDSLKKLNVRWDDASLDKWLSDPDAMASDTDMAFRLADGAERKAVIAYLMSLGGQVIFQAGRVSLRTITPRSAQELTSAWVSEGSPRSRTLRE